MKFYLGYDRREDVVFQVSRLSLIQNSQVNVIPLVQDSLRAHRIYTRGTDERAATDFSLTRFMVPYLAGVEEQWVVFADCDFLFTRDVVSRLTPYLDDRKAVMVVKHRYTPKTLYKMDGNKQFAYARKNWSSFMVWNLWHEANEALDAPVVNAASPTWLHQMQWLDDQEIGELPQEFNFLVGEFDPPDADSESLTKPTNKTPTCLHYTLGIGPYVPPVKDYAALWDAARVKFMQGGMQCEPMRDIQ